MLARQKNASQAVAGQCRSPSKVRPVQIHSPFRFIEFVKARVTMTFSENSFILFLMWPAVPEHLNHGAGADWNVPIPDRPRLWKFEP